MANSTLFKLSRTCQSILALQRRALTHSLRSWPQPVTGRIRSRNFIGQSIILKEIWCFKALILDHSVLQAQQIPMKIISRKKKRHNHQKVTLLFPVKVHIQSKLCTMTLLKSPNFFSSKIKAWPTKIGFRFIYQELMIFFSYSAGV